MGLLDFKAFEKSEFFFYQSCLKIKVANSLENRASFEKFEPRSELLIDHLHTSAIPIESQIPQSPES